MSLLLRLSPRRALEFDPLGFGALARGFFIGGTLTGQRFLTGALFFGCATFGCFLLFAQALLLGRTRRRLLAFDPLGFGALARGFFIGGTLTGQRFL
ncbi:hypothetical protein, partial [Nevskia sp.]|uniref:hypothetical protein n=1 Tax=Nevskia sp. TaxID=1929292 RepID=UPI003F70B2F6